MMMKNATCLMDASGICYAVVTFKISTTPPSSRSIRKLRENST